MSQCCGEATYEGLCVRGRPVKVIDCVACGFKHVHPRPSHAELLDYYKTAYFGSEKVNYEKTSGTESEYQWLVDKEKARAAGMVVGGACRAVLDYGCGPGAPFLKNLFKAGFRFDAYGYEPSQKEADRRWYLGASDQKLACSLNSLDPWLSRPDGPRFDVINMGFVLEHVANPFAELLQARKLLAPAGRLVIEVPNDFSPLQMHLWGKLAGVPWWVSSPDHQNYFSRQSLEGLLGRCGFSLIASGTTYPVELFLAHGADYRKDDRAKRQLVELRADLQRMWSVCRTGSADIGRTVWMVAQEVLK